MNFNIFNSNNYNNNKLEKNINNNNENIVNNNKYHKHAYNDDEDDEEEEELMCGCWGFNNLPDELVHMTLHQSKDFNKPTYSEYLNNEPPSLYNNNNNGNNKQPIQTTPNYKRLYKERLDIMAPIRWEEFYNIYYIAVLVKNKVTRTKLFKMFFNNQLVVWYGAIYDISIDMDTGITNLIISMPYLIDTNTSSSSSSSSSTPTNSLSIIDSDGNFIQQPPESLLVQHLKTTDILMPQILLKLPKSYTRMTDTLDIRKDRIIKFFATLESGSKVAIPNPTDFIYKYNNNRSNNPTTTTTTTNHQKENNQIQPNIGTNTSNGYSSFISNIPTIIPTIINYLYNTCINTINYFWSWNNNNSNNNSETNLLVDDINSNNNNNDLSRNNNPHDTVNNDINNNNNNNLKPEPIQLNTKEHLHTLYCFDLQLME
ncbi:hypothetical protein DFA_10546 [Cavenderia fasciculata]|uniref:Uncharacterized protein n=1 Tax=Cavenderia fasciculata TaxID=261658 RepID=F4QAI5_CACFS|nr:uncharacterized protein DFA_10546 [Cavenderia fasciculata]EGG15704.1 hypothetical protein DFA_10546 [Cavenderia fasciculata]|eukprot:XP_004354446.1 hypothetical protein DFA_10546 [Cavenderia fasciculata]